MIYHEKHLIDPFHHSKKVNLGLNHPGCGISDSTQSWMDQIQHSGEKDDSKGDEQEQKDSNKKDKTGNFVKKPLCNMYMFIFKGTLENIKWMDESSFISN